MTGRYIVLAGALSLGGFLGWQRSPEQIVAATPAATAEIEIAESAKADGESTEPWTTWADRIGVADAAGLERIHAEIEAIGNADAQRPLQRLLAARWVDVDPAGGLAFLTAGLERQGQGKGNPWTQVWLLAEWAKLDMEAAYVAISTYGEKAEGMLGNVASELFETDFPLFWKWYQRAGNIRYVDRRLGPWRAFARTHFDEMVAVATEEAMAADAREKSPSFSGGLLGIVGSLYGERDPQAGLRWIEGLPEEMRNNAAKDLLLAWAEKDPLAASEHLDILKRRQVGPNSYMSGGERELLERIVRKLGETDPLAALKWMAGNRTAQDNGIFEISNVLSRAIDSGKLDFRDAYNAVSAIESPGESIRLNVLPRLWDSLPNEKLGEAAEWLGSLEPSNWHGWATDGLMQKWFQVDPGGFSDYVGAIPDENRRRELVAGAFQRAEQLGADEIVAGLRALPSEVRVAGVLSALNQSSYREDFLEHSGGLREGFVPETYARALEGVPISEDFGRALSQLGRLWGMTDPDSAMEWVEALPPSPERDAGVSSVAASWARYDAYGLSEYLAGAAPGNDRDAAVGALVTATGSKEPDSAWTWAQTIAEAERRNAARAEVARAWQDLDPDAAREAILNDPGLSDAERIALLRAGGTPPTP